MSQQKIIVILSNGRRGIFEGRAIIKPEESKDVTVTQVIFQVPHGSAEKAAPPKPPVDATTQEPKMPKRRGQKKEAEKPETKKEPEVKKPNAETVKDVGKTPPGFDT